MKSLIVIIGNPAARKSEKEKIDRASFFLQQKGYKTEVLLTEKRGDAEVFARNYVEKKPFLILAAGGDGTVNEVINGIVHSDIPLAILPLGTTNVLAKELSIPENIHAALETAVTRTPCTVSLGKIELLQHFPIINRYFALMAGIGFDGKAVQEVNRSLKKISGKAAYVFSGLMNFLHYCPEELVFTIDGRKYRGHGCIIGNASRYGGNFFATPDADIREPILYTFIYQGRKRIDLLRYTIGVLRGTHLKNDDIHYLKSSTIAIYGNAHIQVDGDYLGISPASVSVERDALRLVF